jgi:hypothetical protein
MGLRDILRREFSPANMLSRAARKVALDDVRLDLEMWADYGDPQLLERAIGRLRRSTETP